MSATLEHPSMSATLKELKGSQMVIPVAPPQAYPTIWLALWIAMSRPLAPLACNVLIKTKRAFLLDVVVRQRALILQLLSPHSRAEDQSLVVRWKPCDVFDLCFDVLDCVRSFDVQRECLVLGRFDEDRPPRRTTAWRPIAPHGRVLRFGRHEHYARRTQVSQDATLSFF